MVGIFLANLTLLFSGIWAILYAFGIVNKNLTAKLEERRKKHRWLMVFGGGTLIFLWLRMMIRAFL